MSYSLAIVDGDLSQSGSQLQIVYGSDKLIQDIDLWLRERFGIDRFHVTYGSILEDFIGTVVDDYAETAIQSEVLRVLRNYQKLQKRLLRTSPTSLSLDELLQSVDSINTTVTLDTVQVQVSVSNAVGQQAIVSASATVS